MERGRVRENRKAILRLGLPRKKPRSTVQSDLAMKDIYTATDGNTYSFSGYGGVSNCFRCDAFDQVNEYDRQDGLVVFMCKKCEDRLHI